MERAHPNTSGFLYQKFSSLVPISVSLSLLHSEAKNPKSNKRRRRRNFNFIFYIATWPILLGSETKQKKYARMKCSISGRRREEFPLMLRAMWLGIKKYDDRDVDMHASMHEEKRKKISMPERRENLHKYLAVEIVSRGFIRLGRLAEP